MWPLGGLESVIAQKRERDEMVKRATNEASVARFAEALRNLIGADDPRAPFDLSVISALGRVLAETIAKLRQIDGELAEEFAESISGQVIDAGRDPDDYF